jgi:putative IMPACT (imprinted ancient) family translation regulator
MKNIAALYPKATHHCWAYRFTGSPPTEHCSDAGEPNGTAGRPILGALKKHDLLNITAVVTRYYGGVKLGVHGLIEAYGGCTLEAIKTADIIVYEKTCRVSFFCSYELYNILIATLERHGITAAETEASFTDAINGYFTAPQSALTSLLPALDAISPRKNSFNFTCSSPS